ncbi:MAG: hypothetical protein HQM03_01250 [Magnetococcales bacterium]|nr:hypothetical protein [Magnetococcales bacterium]
MPRLLLAAVLMMVGVTPLHSALAEVTNDEGTLFSRPGHYSLTCWQQGVKIVERGNLATLKEHPMLGQSPLQFVTRGKERLPVQIFNMGETFCIVQGEP